MTEKRYFLDQDSSGHWYVVEVEHRDAWEAWAGLGEDDERSWESPSFARRVGGAPSLVTFEDPQVDL